MPTLVKRIAGALLIILLLYIVNTAMSREGVFGFGIGAYPTDILMLIFVNIILAVSLTISTVYLGGTYVVAARFGAAALVSGSSSA